MSGSSLLENIVKLDAGLIAAIFGLIGVIVGGLITSGASYLIEKLRGETVLKRERRDYLERLGDAFDEYVAAIDALHSAVLAQQQIQNPNDPIATASVLGKIRDFTEDVWTTRQKLSHFLSRSWLYGFDEMRHSIQGSRRTIDIAAQSVNTFAAQGNWAEAQAQMTIITTSAAEFRFVLKQTYDSI